MRAWVSSCALGAGLVATGIALFASVWDANVARAVPAPSQTGTPAASAVEPCASAPAPDTLMGAAGTAPCYVPSDASRPTAVQAANVATDANGNWSVTFGRRFNSATPIVSPLPVNAGTMPILCNVATRAATGATGRCWQSTANTLPLLASQLLGLVLSPFGTNAANISVMVIAREPTQ